MAPQGRGEQEQQLRSELGLEKAQMRRQHERELQAVRDKMADEQVSFIVELEEKRKYYPFWHCFVDRPGNIPGCPSLWSCLRIRLLAC